MNRANDSCAQLFVPQHRTLFTYLAHAHHLVPTLDRVLNTCAPPAQSCVMIVSMAIGHNNVRAWIFLTFVLLVDFNGILQHV